MGSERKPAFAVWLTGLSSSGKSSITRELAILLHARGIRPRVLESDAVRREITPKATYAESERDVFYNALAYIARLLVEHDVTVIVDATANRRAYRDRARAEIPRFVEVHVRCPLEVSGRATRRGSTRGANGTAPNVPGSPPRTRSRCAPKWSWTGEHDDPSVSARKIVEALDRMELLRGYRESRAPAYVMYVRES